MTPLTIFLVSCLVSGGLCFALRGPLIRWKMLDRPVGRSSHDRTTVTAAGLAIILTTALQGLWWGWRSHNNMLVLLQVAMVVGAGVSLTDHRRRLPIKLRLACHAFMALWGLAILQLRWQHAPHWISSLAVFWSGLLVMLWLVGYTNAFNFMDGIDGLASTQAIVTCLGMTFVAVVAGADWSDGPVSCCLSVAGGTAGFLPHNFPRARMFMGDVGSIPLGYVLAFVCIWMSVEYGWELFIPLALLQANFVIDTAVTFVRRVYRGERWWQGHREHFYQRLVRSGQSHSTVTLTEMSLQLAVLILMVAYGHVGLLLRLGFVVIVVALWLVFFGWCEFSFRRTLDGSSTTPVFDR